MYSYSGGGGRAHVESTARSWAAARNLQMLERLVEANPDADLNDVDPEGISALMLACETVDRGETRTCSRPMCYHSVTNIAINGYLNH